jgi:hypothetical protein
MVPMSTAGRELVELLENARPIPLTRGQVRVDAPAAHRLVAAVRETGNASLVAAAEAADDAVRNAQPVPLTDQVRFPRDHVEQLVQGLRAAGA